MQSNTLAKEIIDHHESLPNHDERVISSLLGATDSMSLPNTNPIKDKVVSRQPCNVAKSVVSYLHNQPGRIGYEEIHRDTHRRGS